MYNDHDVQPWPADMNYSNEQHRFGQVARQWNLIYPPGSDEWNAMLAELKELDVTLDPTMTAYIATRDVIARAHCRLARAVHTPIVMGLL